MTFVAIWILVAGAVLLGAGFVMIITQPPDTGANIGAGGAFFFGLGCTGMGLVAGVWATAAWLRARKHEPRPAPLPAWQKRLRRLTAAAVGLISAGAVVQSAGAVGFAHETADSDRSDSYALFLVGLGLVAVGLLAGIVPALYWWAKRSRTLTSSAPRRNGQPVRVKQATSSA
ncbi:hypothetical protein [Amycolatopsis echigonensis]|uniref:Uncharacterized protein n=1 Tax=Amycolatopsis echigonensis TaxID=2576905 RepID=A0A8E2B0N5_9PSEU|nr:hypothetical protein [Amycolatopsis echigonensis]MBB2498557.1 hypothetical protein [Amycolatopsis echigonensis]